MRDRNCSRWEKWQQNMLEFWRQKVKYCTVFQQHKGRNWRQKRSREFKSCIKGWEKYWRKQRRKMNKLSKRRKLNHNRNIWQIKWGLWTKNQANNKIKIYSRRMKKQLKQCPKISWISKKEKIKVINHKNWTYLKK